MTAHMTRPITDREHALRKLRAARALRRRLIELGVIPAPDGTFAEPPTPSPRRKRRKAAPMPDLYLYPIGPVAPWWFHSRPQPKDQWPVRDVAHRICAIYSLPVEFLLSDSRLMPIVAIRQEVMWIAAVITGKNMSVLGRCLSRDRQTIGHGIKKFAKRHGLPADCTSAEARRIARRLLERPSVEIAL